MKHYRKFILKIFLPLWTVFSALSLRTLYLASHTHYRPELSRKELSHYMDKPLLDKADYRLIYKQTGLAPDAIRHIKKYAINPQRQIAMHQQNYYAKIKLSKHDAVWSPQNNQVVDDAGNSMQAFTLEDIRDGDILLSMCSYTSGILHGHAGIIVDAKKELVLEATSIGCPSTLHELSRWYSYTNCIQLRLKCPDTKTNGNSPPINKQIADYALSHLNNRNYNLACGLLCPKNASFDKDTDAGTQCAHLVWSAYKAFGYDIDGNGGKIVTVSDIAGSSLLKPVQLYGINTEEFPILE